MIPRPNIARWKEFAPWSSFDQIEQDLIISRTLVEIFTDQFLNENLAFRGGTALHKLYLNPAPRFSEDIDLVQIKQGPIKSIMEKINEVITFFEEPRKTDIRGHGPKMYYRFNSEYEDIRMRLKIEINQIIESFNEYMMFSTGHIPTRRQFELNIKEKENDPNFIGDMEALLRPGIEFDQQAAFEWLKNDVISKLR